MVLNASVGQDYNVSSTFSTSLQNSAQNLHEFVQQLLRDHKQIEVLQGLKELKVGI